MNKRHEGDRHPPEPKKVAALLLAAGESSRMGSPKQLLPWGSTTLIRYQLIQLKAARVDHIIVVLGYRADEIKTHIVDLSVQVVVNRDYLEGRATSVRAGAKLLTDGVKAVVTLNVDQPRPHELIDALIEAHLSEGNLITVPTHRGRRGHPPVFSGSLVPELCNVSEEGQGLREIMQRHATNISELPWDSDIVHLGMNTPEEYHDALRRYFVGTA